MRYPMASTAFGTALLIAARTCSSFGRTASGCAAMYSSTDFGTLCFIPLILRLAQRRSAVPVRESVTCAGRDNRGQSGPRARPGVRMRAAAKWPPRRRGQWRYLLEDLLLDTGSGHNIVAT